MRFLHVDPKAKTVTTIDADDPYNAIHALNIANTDYGTVSPGLAIIVYEFGLLEGNGPYFAIRGQLYSGDAVLYAYDQRGETIDVPDDQAKLAKAVIWLADKPEVELAIAARLIRRPQASINGLVTWEWK